MASSNNIIKANDPNVFQVKLGKYSERNPKQQFWVPATEPLPSEGKDVSHGGVYYDRSNYEKTVFSSQMYHSLPFERKIQNKKEILKRIEILTKKSRASL